MEHINDYTENSVYTIPDQLLEMSNCFFFIHLQMEPLLDFENGLIRLHADIWDVGINHQAEEIEYEI